MFGRNGERAELRQLLDRERISVRRLALQGARNAKATPWLAAVTAPRLRGFRVVATAPAEPDHALPFAALGDPFEELPEELLRALRPRN